MNQLLEWLSRIFSSWKFWVVVPPWDIAVRVRLGRRAVALRPGPHFRIPWFDEISMVNTRLRIETTPSVTIGNGQPGKARVVTAAIGFRIEDPILAMMAYTVPGTAIVAYAQALMSANRDAAECLAALRSEFGPSGITLSFLNFVENVEVRTFRLLMHAGSNGPWSGPSIPPGTSQVPHW
jgi:hypothetical protein